jgi:hemerythrin
MEKMRWQNNLSIGIELIDNQHKRWIEHYNDVVESLTSQESREQLSKTLGFLIDYTEGHFLLEEKHMSSNRYPGFPEHKAKHDELRSTLAALVREFEEEGATIQLSKAIDTFLGNWLIKHIHEVDTKFGVFVRENKIALA